MNSMLYVVSGTGADTVGLVGAVTSPIAAVRGNIVDMRQSVLHGLFTLCLIVDVAGATVSVEEFRAVVEKISVGTGLKLACDSFTPAAETAEKTHMLVTLVGWDKSGIIAAIAEKLGRYNINIEVAECVAREDIFLMDLLCEVSHGSLPVENLKMAIRDTMAAVRINTMFQTEDVFNKKKKIVLFDIAGSFLEEHLMFEIARQAGIPPAELLPAGGTEAEFAFMQVTAGLLEALPLAVIDRINRSLRISAGTAALMQSLKRMGYRVGMISTGFSFFTDAIKAACGLDYAFGFELPVDDDAQAIIGDLPPALLRPIDRARIVAGLRTAERIGEQDITIISDRDEVYPATPGIRVVFDMKVMLTLFNEHVLNRESLKGLLRSFGIPRFMPPV